jgi:hypothetical protein
MKSVTAPGTHFFNTNFEKFHGIFLNLGLLESCDCSTVILWIGGQWTLAQAAPGQVQGNALLGTAVPLQQ